MRLRSGSQIREALDDATAVVADLESRSDRDWIQTLVLEQHRRRLAALTDELALANEGGLQVALDGLGVADHAISADRLVTFLDPLQTAIRSVGADDVRELGNSFGEHEKQLTAAHVRHMFDGSAGIVILGPDASEQLEVLRATLFERAVGRVLDVLAASTADEVESAVLDAAAGLNAGAVKAMTELADWMAIAGESTRFAWRGTVHPADRPLSIRPTQAAALSEILKAVKPSLEEVTVTGLLAAVDSHDGTFHLVSEEGPEIRGRLAEGLVQDAIRREHQSGVVAVLEVQVAVGAFARRSRPKYVLRAFP